MRIFSFFVLKLSSLVLLVPLFLSCVKAAETENALPLQVRIARVRTIEIWDEIKGFGSLSFRKKFELISPVDGILETLKFREGDVLSKDDAAALIKNPQINLAARKADDTYSQALSALDLAEARLKEGEFRAETRLLENEKSAEELAQARKVLEEERRKSKNREALYAAGGLSDEAIREERFRLAEAETRFLLMEKELEIRRIGLRNEDLAASGVSIPADENELRKALVSLSTTALRAETGAARANLEAASRERESSRLLETELVVKSPGSGIVGARYVEEGERIKKDDRILTIMDMDSLYAIFPVPESEAGKLKKGMSAQVIAGGDESCEGEVDLISPQADHQSFTFLVRILLAPRKENHLKPGMFARVIVPSVNPKTITVIPESALARKKENSGKVFTVHNNILSERNVILGMIVGNEREVVSGLVPGEVVVLNSTSALREGVYVSATE